jgi:hypothetical protein
MRAISKWCSLLYSKRHEIFAYTYGSIALFTTVVIFIHVIWFFLFYSGFINTFPSLATLYYFVLNALVSIFYVFFNAGVSLMLLSYAICDVITLNAPIDIGHYISHRDTLTKPYIHYCMLYTRCILFGGSYIELIWFAIIPCVIVCPLIVLIICFLFYNLIYLILNLNKEVIYRILFGPQYNLNKTVIYVNLTEEVIYLDKEVIYRILFGPQYKKNPLIVFWHGKQI